MEAVGDAVMLARVQFAANITFHILFPAITIALAWVLLYFRVRYNRGGGDAWLDAYRFWVKVFALTFAIGIVSGVTMSFQFGTNWPGYMETVGNIAGPLLAYEVLTAFFLEASFLGIMLFGVGRVSRRVHTLATFLVAAGTTLSAFWILALNSWMQTPVGFEMIEGRAYATDWLAILFNPSFPYRFTHMLIASGLTAAFLVAGVSAWRWRRGERGGDVRAALRTGVVMAATLIPLQIVVGDLHGLNTFHHQPAKLAAMEGIWETQRGAAAVLFGLPDEAAQRNRYEVAIPGLASLYLGHSWDAEIRGLKDFPGAHPPVAPVFWAFRIMVGVGLLMLAVSWYALWDMRRRGEPGPLASRALVLMTFSGWVALVAGWYVTEIGRQPWLVYGVLSTAEAASTVPAGRIGLTLAMYLTLYAALLTAFISVVFHLARKAGEGERAKDMNPVNDPFRAGVGVLAPEPAGPDIEDRGGHA
ncbi:cyanide insensitive terminal oxidase subunit I [Azoarcus olearius]|uniref:cytochrome ubiquinol oxidase subunit I n=1 Tax=Azoarcus sp. (strain BH72) TaxID=418699 RepID=UPI000806184F|nr:cytochrome ubiquinol oxidase subunit I [Azoarcus olearius]ANQ84959.1 cyanide insensitive terminal oxidase subunit I [Azoarcus olearius]